ncbi:MAG: fatty acid desaturase [Spirochaetia bacterium]|nr:fatty acid desaturase [Spirochaetia bacterium]
MGVFIALVVIALWGGHLFYLLFIVQVDYTNILTYLHILIQGYLYTGLFITAHDSMHGAVSSNRRVNKGIGQLALWLFAAFSFQRMFLNHMKHHTFVATEKDPDYCIKSQNPFKWFFSFFLSYITVRQIVTMALLFNILLYVGKAPLSNLLLFWIIPPFLGTFQLFYFGTYFPHKLPHTAIMEPHRSRTMKKNHLLAMLSCWFFSYHYEHHEYPRTPWWQLYKRKKS